MSLVTDEFREITGVDIAQFFEDYITFVDTHLQRIIDYYNGADIDQDAFNFFDSLKDQANNIENTFSQYLKRFCTTDYWELVDRLGDIQVKLSTVDNLSRWQRSSRLNRFDSNVSIEYIQGENETLERISRGAGFINYENDWQQLAIDNNTIEEDYTSQGGVILNIVLANNANFQIRNIVDNLNGDNLKGKDIKNKIEFENNDIVTVTGDEAIEQTLNNIFSTLKGSIPEFLEDGIDPNVIGSNVTLIQYPTIFRGLIELIQKDDRFNSITLIDVVREDDNVFMQIRVDTKAGNAFFRNFRL